jgi:uncharacterized membrane protein SpoIIM required for sporulation
VHPVHLLSMLKKEIKDKSNSDKITFYTFKTLNAQFPRKIFHNNLLFHFIFYAESLMFYLVTIS